MPDLELMRASTDVNNHRAVDGQQRFRAKEKLRLSDSCYPVANFILRIPDYLI